MRTIIFIIAAGILSLNAVDDFPNRLNEIYCAEMKDGIITVLSEGKAIGTDVVLQNGTTVTLHGTVIAKDGSKFLLSDGDCIDPEGNLIDDDINEKIKSEPYK